MGVQHIVSPQGDVLVVMPLAHFQRMSAAAGPFMLASEMPHNGSAASEGEPDHVRKAIDAGESPLAAWRRHRDISQSELARLAGVSRFTVMRMEASGAGAGNRQSRESLARALGVPTSAI